MPTDAESPLLERVAHALCLRGWRPSSDAPVVVLPRPRTFVRRLANGWAVTLTLAPFRRDEVEVVPWRGNAREAVEVESAATFPPAEVLAAHLGTPPDLGLDVGPPFRAEDDGEGEAENLCLLRGPEDYDRVVDEIVTYAEDVVVPAAEDAGLDRWLAAYTAIGRDDPEVLTRKIPVMLVAHGYGTEAVVRLRAAQRDPELSTAECRVFGRRVEAFVRSNRPLPRDGTPLVALAAEHERRCAAAVAGASASGSAHP